MNKTFAVYFESPEAGRGSEPVAGPFNTKQEAGDWMVAEGHTTDPQYFVDRLNEAAESYRPLVLLREMLAIVEVAKPEKPRRTRAASIYHRDYLRTKHKLYRKYQPKK